MHAGVGEMALPEDLAVRKRTQPYLRMGLGG